MVRNKEKKKTRRVVQVETKFGNTAELDQMTATLDLAELQPVKVGTSDTDEYVGIYNKSRSLLESIVPRKESMLIQHKDAIQAFTKACVHEGVDVKGSLKNFGGEVIVEAEFRGEQQVKDGTDAGVTIGARLVNNYSSTKLRASGYGVRSVCSNGMIFGGIVSGVFRKHEKQELIEKEMIEMVSNIKASTAKLQKLINVAREEKLPTIDEMEEIIMGQIKNKKKAKAIAGLFEKGDLTKYGIYNALTNYATHQVDTEKERGRLQRIAQRVLITPEADLEREPLDDEE